MPNITGHTELVGLMAYPIRHTQSPTTHNLAYDKNGDDVIQLAFEVDNDSLKDAVQSIRALKMLGSNISMPNKTVVVAFEFSCNLSVFITHVYNCVDGTA